MILRANWKAGRFQGVEVGRGELVSSYSALSSESGLSVKAVRTALNHLIGTGEVAVKRHPKFTVFSIKNYDKYQVGGRQEGTEGAQEGQGKGTEGATIEERKKEIKQENNKKTMCAAAALFERLWEKYPCKKGKGQVSDTQKKRLLAIGEPALVKAIERYSAALQQDAGWRKPQNGSTFFNSGYVDYLDENYRPEEACPKPANINKNGFCNFEQRDTDYDAIVAEQMRSEGIWKT